MISYWIGWSFFRISYSVLFGWTAYNRERVPKRGPVILASNHASFLDPPLVGIPLKRPLNFLARETLFRYPGVGATLRSWQAVPVDREGSGGRGLKAILDRLLRGGGILLFPEGTRTHDGKLQAGRSGIGLAVIKSNASVIPVRVFGTYEAFGRHVRLLRRHHIRVKYGNPMQFAELRAEAKTCSKVRLKQIYQQIADEIMTAIAKLEPCEDKNTFP